MSNSDLITKIPTVIKLLGNPNWDHTVVAGENQTSKFVFTKVADDGETEVIESKYFKKSKVNKCLNKAPKIAKRNAEIIEDLQLEIISDLGECDMYLSLNHKDGSRVVGRTTHVEVKTTTQEEVRILGLKRHKNRDVYDGIYTVILVPHDWAGRANIYWRGINFTIERK